MMNKTLKQLEQEHQTLEHELKLQLEAENQVLREKLKKYSQPKPCIEAKEPMNKSKVKKEEVLSEDAFLADLEYLLNYLTK